MRSSKSHLRRLAVALVVLSAGWAQARTIAVPGDAPTIKGALFRARAGDIVLVSCGVYREADIVLKPGVSLWSGTLQPDCVVIDAGGRGRCLIIADTDSTTRVVGLTLRGGRATGPGEDGRGGALYADDTAAVLSRCVLEGNTATAGGAVATRGRRGPRLEQCEIRSNTADRDGGAVHWSAEGGRLVGCTLTANRALRGGGALATAGGALVVDRCLLAENEAGATGGALHVAGTDLLVTGSVLRDNSGGLAGGALFCRDAAPRVQGCTLHANTADGAGTLLGLRSAVPRFENCLVTASGGDLVTTDGELPTWRSSNVLQADGTWPELFRAQRDRHDNLAADPMYCDPAAGDLHLAPGSPCLRPEGRVGALGAGCGARFPPDVVD